MISDEQVRAARVAFSAASLEAQEKDGKWSDVAMRAALEAAERAKPTVDPREPDQAREGMFRDHNCSRCEDGRRICVRLDPRGCEFPVARND